MQHITKNKALALAIELRSDIAPINENIAKSLHLVCNAAIQHYIDQQKVFEFDDLDRELLAKCQEGVECIENGEPLKDVMDPSDIEEAICLLVKLGKFHKEIT